MKILDLICSLDPAHGGPQHTVRSITKIWRDMGHEVDIVTLDAPDAPYLDLGITVHALGRLGSPTRQPGWSALLDRYAYAPGAARTMAAMIHDYDVVLIHGLWNYAALLARRVLIDSGVPFFVFPHGMLDPWHREKYPVKDLVKQLQWRFNEGALLRHASATFFTTQAELALADQSYRPYKTNAVLVGYGCMGPDGDATSATEAFHAAYPELRERKFLLFLSRIHPKKGCDTLIRAFAECRAELGDVDLVMAGPDQVGWTRELAELATTLGVARHVHWIGMIGGAVKWGAYYAAEAFVLPSHGENFGIVVAEAMACGTPVIVSDRVNLCDAVLRHGAGLVAPHDLHSTIAAIRQFAAMSTDERAEMSRNATQCYHANYEIETAARRIVDTMASYAGRKDAPILRAALPA